MPNEQLESKLLEDPSVSYWLKAQMRALDARDILDALLDIEMLLKVAKARASRALGIEVK